MIDGITNTTSSNTTTSSTKEKTTLGKDDFMKLMITQLKYQDPMNPLDSSQYSAQLAQFSSLEQLTNLNDNIQKSIDANYYLTQSINNTMTATLIGKDVKLSGDKLNYTGQANCSLGYKLPAEASSVKINIYNSDGSLVKTIESLPESTGEHKLSYDFTDNNGNKLAQGNYTFEIVAKGSNQENMTTEIYKTGTIDSVKFTDSGTKIIINSEEYNLSDILEITNTNTNTGKQNG